MEGGWRASAKCRNTKRVIILRRLHQSHDFGYPQKAQDEPERVGSGLRHENHRVKHTHNKHPKNNTFLYILNLISSLLRIDSLFLTDLSSPGQRGHAHKGSDPKLVDRASTDKFEIWRKLFFCFSSIRHTINSVSQSVSSFLYVLHGVEHELTHHFWWNRWTGLLAFL